MNNLLLRMGTDEKSVWLHFSKNEQHSMIQQVFYLHLAIFAIFKPIHNKPKAKIALFCAQKINADIS